MSQSSNLTLHQCSILAGEELTIELPQGAGYEGKLASVSVFSVHELWDMEAMGTGVEIAADGTISLREQSKNLQPGLYFIGLVQIVEPTDGHVVLGIPVTQREDVVFEVRDSTSPARSEAEVIDSYRRIIQVREAEFRSGLGDSAKHGGTSYTCLVFIKNCLITSKIKLGKLEIIPFEGLSCLDEIESVQKFCLKTGVANIDNIEGFLSNAKQSQPVAVIHYPKVFAGSPERAGEVAEEETAVLNDVLSINRGGYATTFASVILCPDGSVRYRIDLPTYTGNLLGGVIAGENPENLYKSLKKAKEDERLQLYLSLFKEALKETRLEIGYFRLWNILETVGRAKGLVGTPVRDWSGNIQLNRTNQPILVQNQAEDIVRELLKSTLTAGSMGPNSFSSGMKQGTIEQMLAIWYRHRNCMGHSGGCHAQDPSICSRSVSKFINCKSAHDEIITQHGERTRFTDQYYRALESVTRLVIECELASP